MSLQPSLGLMASPRTLSGYNRPSQNIRNRAGQIWQQTPTPLYDEFMSLRKATTMSPYDKDLAEDQKLFWSYVERLKATYPTCKVDIDPRGPSGSRRGNTFQTFESSGGMNYYSDFQRQERACQVDQAYPRVERVINKRLALGAISTQQRKPIQQLDNLSYYFDQKEKEEKAERNAAEKARLKGEKLRANLERRRYAAVRQANILGLTGEPELSSSSNLLGFEPTQQMKNQMLRERETELGNLFRRGGKSKKNKKSLKKKTRKVKRN